MFTEETEADSIIVTRYFWECTECYDQSQQQ